MHQHANGHGNGKFNKMFGNRSLSQVFHVFLVILRLGELSSIDG